MSSSVSGELGPAVIREARDGDGRALQLLDVAAWSADVSPAPPPDARGEFFGNGVSPQDILVAEFGGEVIGYVKWAPRYPGLTAAQHVYEITGLAVTQERERNGVGRQLVLAAAEAAFSRGALRLTLNVLAPNQVARRLYERCGFVVEGVHTKQFFLDGRWVDDLALALDRRSTQGPT